MKAFVEYYDYLHNGKLYNPCGDRAVLVLDGRNNLDTMINDAIANNGVRRPKYPHFKIMREDFKHATCVYQTFDKDLEHKFCAS